MILLFFQLSRFNLSHNRATLTRTHTHTHTYTLSHTHNPHSPSPSYTHTTFIHRRDQKGISESINSLLKAGADVNACSRDTSTLDTTSFSTSFSTSTPTLKGMSALSLLLQLASASGKIGSGRNNSLKFEKLEKNEIIRGSSPTHRQTQSLSHSSKTDTEGNSQAAHQSNHPTEESKSTISGERLTRETVHRYFESASGESDVDVRCASDWAVTAMHLIRSGTHVIYSVLPLFTRCESISLSVNL